MKLQRLLSTIVFLALVLRGGVLQAQEFNFTVKVLNPTVRLADPKVFVSLENALKELVNGTKWTDDIFEQNERLTGTIQMTIDNENTQKDFTVKLTIQVNRPVYGTDATTPLFIHLDKAISFSYEQFQPLQFNKNNFTDNLTATIGYYMYVILAMDYDSFAPNGGDLYWQTAQDIYNILPEAAKSEWKGKELGNQNRYWFVENMLSPRLKGFRQGIYEYHRLGLDYATTDMNRCKTMILQALERMDEAHQGYPNTLAVRMFSLTKADELVEIFKGAAPDQKNRFLEIMKKIDAANASKYANVGF
ncbi:MAG: DUF4835 family protein [Saprospiraceae bacterium]|nr:DUF4835 family protein [Saprospiraceae bacterium]